eukprot:780733-Rhodomonas_salina.1
MCDKVYQAVKDRMQTRKGVLASFLLLSSMLGTPQSHACGRISSLHRMEAVSSAVGTRQGWDDVGERNNRATFELDLESRPMLLRGGGPDLSVAAEAMVRLPPSSQPCPVFLV